MPMKSMPKAPGSGAARKPPEPTDRHADFDSPPPLGTTDRSRYVKVKTVEEAQQPEMRKWIEQAGRVPGW